MNIVEQYINDNEWSKTNANHNRSASGLKTHIADNVLRDYALSEFGEFGALHKQGAIYLHNLDGGPYMPYCAGHSLETLLMKGLVNPIGMSSKPARHLDTALDHIVNASYMFTQEFMGAQAWRDIDVLLAPYVYEDGLDYEGVKQAVQRAIWNVSFPLRSGFQSMFLNFTFGLRPSKYYDGKPVLMPGGETSFNLTYNDLQGEIDMINEAFLNVMIEGADGKPFTFPLPTINITKDFKWNSDIANLIFDLAAKWGTPYFSNLLNTNSSEEDLLSMCCRLNLNLKEIHKVSGGIWNFGNDTGSLAVATINMAQLGYLTKGDEGAFYNRLDALLEKSRDYLLLKKKYVLKGLDLGLFPMIQSYIGKKIGVTFFLTIGINGLNECSLNFSGKDIVQNVNWCEAVMKHLNKRVLEFQQETGHLFNLESTPCFTADTKVSIKHRNQYKTINISDLDKYDISNTEILTENGFRNIKKFIKLPYNDHLLHIELRNGSYMNVTNDHPCVIKSENGYVIKPASEVTCGDDMAFLTDEYGGTLGDYDLGRFIGLYAAEGNKNVVNSIKFSFNIEEIDLIKFVRDFSEKRLGLHCYEEVDEKNHSRKITVFGKGIVGLVYDFVTEGKQPIRNVSSTIMNTSKEFRNGFVDGIFEGDGRKEKGGFLHLSSRELILSVANIMNSIGRKYTFKTKTYDGKKNYYLYPTNGNSPQCNPNKKYIKEHGFYWLKVEKKEQKNTIATYVYDVEVDSDSHLIRLSNGIVTHNCEGASYTLAKVDRSRFHDIVTGGTDEASFYTGSSLIPHGYEIDIVSALRHQEKLQRWYTGGCIFHVDIGEAYSSPGGVKDFIRGVCTKTTLPYVTWSPSYCLCPVHGKTSGKNQCCGKGEVFSRIVGFYRPTSRWNKGKMEEFKGKIFMNLATGEIVNTSTIKGLKRAKELKIDGR